MIPWSAVSVASIIGWLQGKREKIIFLKTIRSIFFLQDVKSRLLNTPLPVLTCNSRSWGQISFLAVINTFLQEDCH